MSDFDFFPEKPVLVEKKTKARLDVTVFSMVLFVASFVWFFKDSFLFVLGLLIVLSIHELGHFLMMKMYKYENVKMLFVPFMGAFVQGKKEKYSQKESFVVVMAGPIPGIALGMICFFLGFESQNAYVLTLSLIFIALNIINLFPLDPLDGGQIFRLLNQKRGDLFQLIFSLISSLVLIGIGIYSQNWLLILFGFFMSFRVRNLQKAHVIRKEMTENGLNFRVTYAELSNGDYSKIRQYVLANNSALRKFIELNSDYDDNEVLIAKEVQNTLAPPLTIDTSFNFKAIAVILWLSALFGPVIYFLSTNLDMTWYYEIIRNW